MSIHIDDPRLTAYVLGELNEQERTVVESAMASSTELRRVVDEIRATTELLASGFSDQTPLTFTAEQRSMLESAYLAKAMLTQGANGSHVPLDENQHEVWAFAHRITRRWWVPTSIAASLVIAAVGAGLSFDLQRTSDSQNDWQFATNENSATVSRQIDTTEPRASARASSRSTLVDQTQGLPEYPDSPDANGQERYLYSYETFVTADSDRTPVGSWDIMASGAPVDSKLRKPTPILKSGTPTASIDVMRNADGIQNALVRSRPILKETSQLQQQMARTFGRLAFRDTATPNQFLASSSGTAEDSKREALVFGLPSVHRAFENIDYGELSYASYGYPVPFGPGDTPSREGTDNRQVLAANRSPRYGPFDDQFHAGGMALFAVGHASFDRPPDETVHGQFGRVAGTRFTTGSSSLVDALLLNQQGSAKSGVRWYDYTQPQLHYQDVDVEQLAYLLELRETIDDQSTHLRSGSFDGEIYVPYNPYPQRRFSPIAENPFKLSEFEPLSTFAIDVDTAGYSLVRQSLNANAMPPAPSVRIEELINYFDYEYPLPTGDDPFSVSVDITDCPWRSEHLLARIGLKGQEYEIEDQPLANLVFLIDTSGSMNAAKKLSLVKESLRLLVDEMTVDDTIAIVTYATEASLALPATSCYRSTVILETVDALEAGGSTNGEDGIHQAYDIALENYIEGGINRVILATDGDFNVGASQRDALKELIADRASDGVFLTVLGFGRGNYSDAKLEALADTGNGSYHYIDSINEAHKVLVDQLGGTLMTIAKDVKIQVEFNPNEVVAYRMLGYENRKLAARDFNDDTKDAGEIGAGHSVTVFYEIIPANTESDRDFDLLDTLEETAVPAAESYDAAHEKLEDEAVVYTYAVPDAASFDAESNEDVVADDPVVSEESGVDDVPAGADLGVDPLRYQLADDGAEALEENGADAEEKSRATDADGKKGIEGLEAETMLVRIRYKEPDGDVSKLIELPVVDQGLSIEDASDDYRFAAAVASFGMLLRGSPHKGDFTFESVIELAESCLDNDPAGDREEFLYLVEKAMALTGK